MSMVGDAAERRIAQGVLNLIKKGGTLKDIEAYCNEIIRETE